ncbi:MAG: GntR family transcriptional regulator [Litorilinea sp.]
MSGQSENFAMISKNSPVPRYYQLAEHIRVQIQSGKLRPGDRLPSERDLSQQAGVSRMTARQALAYLARAGLLHVRHGIGAFIAEPKVAYPILHLRSFTESMAQAGKDVFSRVLVQAVGVPPPNVADALHMPPHGHAEPLVRLPGVEEVPLLLETSYISHRLCPGLDTAELTDQSLYALFESQYGLNVTRAQQTFEATTASDYEQQIFGLDHEVPMLLLEGVTFTGTDLPLEYFKAVYRGDRCSFAFESRRTDAPIDTPAAQLSVRIS